MNTCTRSFMVNGRTKIPQMDKLLPRGVHESHTTTMAMTITITQSNLLPFPLPLRYSRFSSAAFANFSLTRLSPPFCTLNTTTDFFNRSFLKAPDSVFLCAHHGEESARYPSFRNNEMVLFVSFISPFCLVFLLLWIQWFYYDLFLLKVQRRSKMISSEKDMMAKLPVIIQIAVQMIFFPIF